MRLVLLKRRFFKIGLFKLVKILVPILLLFGVLTVIFRDSPDIFQRPSDSYEGKFPDDFPKPNKTILKDPNFVLQNDQIKGFLDKEWTSQFRCFQNTKEIEYILCHEPNDIHAKELVEHRYNLHIAGLMLKLLSRIPNAALIDVGGNIGTVALPVLNQLKGSRKVLILEPNPTNIAALLLGLQKNKQDKSNWAILPRALWNASDQLATMNVWIDSSNGNLDFVNKMDGVHLEHVDKNNRKVAIKTGTFDEYVLPVLEALDIKVAIMKIDIEGSECIAITKAEKLLSRVHIPYILMEYWPGTPTGAKSKWYLTEFSCIHRMLQILVSFNYRPFRPWTPNEEMMDLNNYMNWKEIDVLWKKRF